MSMNGNGSRKSGEILASLLPLANNIATNFTVFLLFMTYIYRHPTEKVQVQVVLPQMEYEG